MADKRGHEERDGEPKIKIVDRRMLNDEERSGSGGATPGGATSGEAEKADSAEPPKLEIIGGGASRQEPAPTAPDGAAVGESPEAGFDDEPLTAEEQAQLQAEMEQVEQEQFAALETQMGRPLTEREKDAVRAEMEKQARSMQSLEVAPLLQQLMAELSARAAVHLGLMPNPYTRLIARNDAQARLAIDAFGALYDLIKPQLDSASQREYGRVLNDLRTNFVSVTGASTTGPSRIIR
ncbi:MAG TPA: DUF1844 domain-containing protein [Abditibacteriaceae bacterium]|nr:DUF1844 domain-containing protein [Abditibacteriaceae bacterium]